MNSVLEEEGGEREREIEKGMERHCGTPCPDIVTCGVTRRVLGFLVVMWTRCDSFLASASICAVHFFFQRKINVVFSIPYVQVETQWWLRSELSTQRQVTDHF